uniref:NTR domain-containing protein n=1 Tax=Caenorhabditis tropicalis TaxID=1561998 RepID=A0A1I7UQB7_9PELO
MARFTTCFYIILLLRIVAGIPVTIRQPQPPHQMSNKISDSWTEERLCVLKMGSSCPSGFTEDKLKLSVQTDVNPKDTDRDGEQLIMMGQAGETSLTRNVYDALYTLTITTCCK